MACNDKILECGYAGGKPPSSDPRVWSSVYSNLVYPKASNHEKPSMAEKIKTNINNNLGCNTKI